MTSSLAVATVADLTPEWLSAVVGTGTVSDFSTERIGTGQVSENHRVTLTYSAGDGPAAVIVKVAASDETSRSSGVSMGLYEREVRFYQDVAPSIDSRALAGCLHAEYEPESGTFCLVLEDVSPATVGNELDGASPGAARLAVAALAELHAPCIGHPSLESAPWLNRESPITGPILSMLYTGFVERYSDRLDPRHTVVADTLVAGFERYQQLSTDSVSATGLVHGDYRLDNLLFSTDDASRPVIAVDWQTVTWGPAATDLSYLLGTAMTTDDRRAHSDELVALYHQGLGDKAPAHLDEFREDVRLQTFFGIIMAIVSPMLVERTGRGDEMFMAAFSRNCEHALDLDAVALLPEPTDPTPLRPESTDEAAHTPGADELWNESWYFDVADEAAGIGAFVRLGITPALDNAWYTAMICGPGIPTIAILDFDLAPPAGLAVSTDTVTATHEIVEELTHAHVTLTGRGEAFDDPADILGDHPNGRAVQVSLDLHWHTDGDPYLYRLTPRYEIPCRVTGVITISGDGIDLAPITIGAPGQRDHSWGVRDWWGMDWVWTTSHFPDGTHLHGLDLRIPQIPAISIGYAQHPGQPTVELNTHRATEVIGDDGLARSTALQIEPGTIALDFHPLGHGPLRLVAEDGRVAYFPRAWGTWTDADGRRGVGWVEWNRNLPG
ncbi:DUF7064 domain-containing protein [Williamsia phyllosphaerae]|uniref:Phosphotransferase n=1 Tax=Williamsia phyllosphaerae TaxID=885042 RepID=A0ABQ1UGA4_9NOCA|nr:phosphotransferase [Williamsia phyllosphaerae]GGF17400.1 phosphotransferase [Williamsia phyllosphaerae]